MDKWARRFVSCITAYVVVGAISGAWIENHTPKCAPEYTKFCSTFEHNNGVLGASLFWPAYWLWQVAVWVTK